MTTHEIEEPSRTGPYNGEYVVQIGNDTSCARKGCQSKPRRRVILGAFVLQVYVCNKHVLWAIDLEKVGHTRGEAMGWHYGYPGNGLLTIKSVVVVDLLAQIRAAKYGRDASEEIGITWKAGEK